MEKKNLSDIERLEIRSDLVKAYLINMTKSTIFVAALIGVFYFVIYILGENPFVDAFHTMNIPLVYGRYAFISFIALFFISALFNTLSLTSFGLIFEGDTLIFSYGSLFRVTKSTPITNIIRVNYRKYALGKMGDIFVEFTGTQENRLRVQYVSDVEHKCNLVNKLISFKKSEQAEEIREKGVEE